MNLKKNIITLLILIFSIYILGNVKCYATTGSFSVSKSSVSLKKGNSSTVTLTVKNCEGAFTVTSSDTSVATASISNDGWVSGTATITIKAKKAGSAKITVTATNVADNQEEPQDVTGSKTIKVTVTDTTNSSNTSNKSTTNNTASNNTNNENDNKPTETKVSTDATLKNLGITPSQYDFTGFRKMTTSYSVTVPNSVETISIYAYANDSKATVTGTGSKKLTDGINTFSVKVTAEDKKTTKTYTLKITKEKEEEKTTDDEEKINQENNDNKKEENDIVGLTNIQVEGLELTPSFSNDIYEYNVTASSDTNALDIKTEKSSDDISIEIVGNEDLKLGENVITLLVYNSKKDETTTYQIVATLENPKVDLTEVNDSMSKVQRELLAKKIIIIGTLVVIVMLIIVFVVQRNKILSKNEFLENNDKEGRIDLSKDESMFERINENTEVVKKKTGKKKGNHFK